MRIFLATWFRVWADWLSPIVPLPPLPPLVDPALLAAAQTLTADTKAILHTPSYKRLMVAKQLAVAFPHVRARDRNLAIELALR